MTKLELKSKFPETYNEVVMEGVKQERQRIEAEQAQAKEIKEAFNFK